MVKYCLRMEDFRGEQRRSVVTKLIANEMGGGGHGGVIRILQCLIGGSGKFYPDMIKFF